MPSKSRSKRGSPEKALSRTALLKEYGLSDKTLRRLEYGLKILTLPRVSGRGRVLYQVDGRADFILKLARNCPDSFSGFRPPFLRFLFLSFLTTPTEEIVDGLTDRGILNRAITVESVERIRTQFLRNLPTVIRKMVENGEEPETDAQEESIELLLGIWGISTIYNNPEYLDEYYFANVNLLHFMNQLVWSHSASDEIKAGIMCYASGQQVVTPAGMSWYKRIFHDQGFMREKDFQHYFQGLSPSVRAAYREALSISTEELVIRSELAHNSLRELHYFSRKLKTKVRELLDSNAEGARAEALKIMVAALKVDDQIGKLKPEEVGTTPSHLENLTLAEYDFDATFQIPDELKQRKGHGEETG